jgi:ABC-2 type transport system ATP-binding protein
MNFLETENVVKQYAGHLALNKVSIQVPQGTIFGLLGPNGAGKTTLIRIINRITAPDSGIVRFNGHESSPEDIYQIGYLPEERGLYKKMKVGEQAIYLAQLKGLSYPEARSRLTRWFEKFDIMPWCLHFYPYSWYGFFQCKQFSTIRNRWCSRPIRFCCCYQLRLRI